MAIDEQQHVALPKLMGQPAYARPPRHTSMAVVRPLDPDDLPLEVFLDGDELEHARELRAKPFVAVPVGGHGDEGASLGPSKQRGLSVKSFTSRFLGNGTRS
ncbi:MAG TPA: hypothetical protein VIH00_05445 [Candidatus Limnocylindrales bacterium]